MTELSTVFPTNLPNSGAPELRNERGRVLVVDDDESIVGSIEALLEDEFVVRTAPGVREALAIIGAETIDVLVTDFQLSDGTGDTVVAQAAAEARSTFAILLTGLMDDPRVVSLGQANSVLVLRKPFDSQALIEWVRHGLALARLAAATRAPRAAPVG
jgi:DNA-binding NtrC family response regulator